MKKIKEVFNKIWKQTDMLGILIILLMFNISFINEILINYSLKYKFLPFITILIFLKFLQEYIYLYIPVYYIIKSIDKENKEKNRKTRIYQTLFISLILKNTIKLNYIIILINIYILIKMFLKKYPTKKDITKVNKLTIISIIIYIVAYIITYTQEYSKYKFIISASIVGGLILINIFNHYRYKENLKLNENKINKNECNINERNILVQFVQFIPLILFLTNSLTTPGFITIIICLISTIYIFIKSNTKQRILLLSLWLLQPIINNEEFFTIFSKPKVMSDYVAINIILTYIFMKLYLKKKVEIVSVITLILTVINIISSIYYIFSNQYLFGYGFNKYIYINIVLLIITILNYYENKKYNIKFGKIAQKISEYGNKLYKFAVDNLPAIIVFILIMVETSLINIPYIKSTFSTGICLIGIVLIYLLEHPIGLLIYLTTFVLVNTGYSIFDSSIIMKIIINMLLLFTFVYLIIKTYFRKNVKKTYILALIMLISLKNLKITNEFFYKINEISNSIIPFTLILVAIMNMYEQMKYHTKNKKKKVVFGINSLKIGGAERALVDLVKKIYNAYDVTIYTIYGNGTFEKELEKLVLDKKITLKTIFKKEPKNALVKKMQMYLIHIFYPFIYAIDIENIYDVEIAFVEGIMTKMFALKSRAKKIAWVHFGASNIINKQQDSVKIRNYTVLKRDIDRITYLKYNDIIFVSNTAKENFLKEFGDKIADKVSMHVIYKYLDIKRIKELSEEYIPQEITPTITSIVTVAKIIPEKGIDRLLDVHERLIKDGFIHNIYVIGDGIDRERLINETKKRKLKHSFRLIGEVTNPYPYIKAGNYFALLSKVEGYGIVIDEAKVLRKEILITKTASIEAVQKYSNIHIFENTEEDVYNGIKNILGTKEKNKKNKKEIVNNLHIFERINDSKIYDIINIINK